MSRELSPKELDDGEPGLGDNWLCERGAGSARDTLHHSDVSQHTWRNDPKVSRGDCNPSMFPTNFQVHQSIKVDGEAVLEILYPFRCRGSRTSESHRVTGARAQPLARSNGRPKGVVAHLGRT